MKMRLKKMIHYAVEHLVCPRLMRSGYFMASTAAKAVLLALALLPLSCEALVNAHAFYPDTRVPRQATLPSPVAELRLRSDDGVALHALHFRHAVKASRALIYFHGNAGNVYHRMAEASALFDLGCDVLLLSYRGYGKSQGSPSERGIYRDGACIYDYACTVLGYEPGRIYLYGRSLGTAVAVELARKKPLGGVILVTPFTSGEDLARSHGMGLLALLARGRFASIEKINEVSAPTLVIHGTADEVVPYGLGVKLFQKYGGRKDFVAIEGGRHNDLEYVDPHVYWGALKKFLADR